MAGVSVDYYVRLEQGRPVNPSDQVLDALARALGLDDTERAHLVDLARPAPASAAIRKQRVRPGVRLLLDQLRGPGFILGPRLEVLATNRMARALLCDFDALPLRERNHAPENRSSRHSPRSRSRSSIRATSQRSRWPRSREVSSTGAP